MHLSSATQLESRSLDDSLQINSVALSFNVVICMTSLRFQPSAGLSSCLKPTLLHRGHAQCLFCFLLLYRGGAEGYGLVVTWQYWINS